MRRIELSLASRVSAGVLMLLAALTAMQGHVLAEGEIIGTYRR